MAIGTNDCQIDTTTGKSPISTDEYRENLDAIFKITKKFIRRHVVVNLLPVDESKVFPMPWKPSHGYRNSAIKKFNGVLINFSEHQNLELIDIHSKFIKNNYRKLLIDGVHPNDEGHELIFEQMKKIIFHEERG